MTLPVIEQSDEATFLPGILTGAIRTLGASVTVVLSVAFPTVINIAVPNSFLSGLDDCANGRTVDMEHAVPHAGY